MKDVENIYRHFTAKLSVSEQEQFNARLAVDQAFRELVAEYEALFAYLRSLKYDRLYTKFRQWSDDFPSERSLERLESIQRYLRAEMSPAERTIFEQHLAEDPELAEQLADYKPIMEGLRAAQITKTATRFQSWAKELPVSSKKGNRLRSIYGSTTFRIAAAIALLVISSIGLQWYANTHYSTPALVSTNYAPRTTSATRSDVEDSFREGYQAFQAREFAAAGAFFARISPDDPRYAEAQLMLGFIYFESEQFAAAEEAWQLVLATNDQRFSDNADWHLVLLELRADPNSETVTEELARIAAQDDHAFSQKAAKLQRKRSGFLRWLARD